MKKYDELTGRLEQGELSLIYVEAVPRSVSTALCRALNETPEPTVFINEPFNRTLYDRELAATSILEVLDRETTAEHQALIMKNIARNISAPILHELVHFAQGVIWVVRDPHIQISALLTRVFNDITFEPGARVLATSALTDENIQAASDFLERGPTSTDFSKTSWAAIGEHFGEAQLEVPQIVVDGTQLTHNPSAVLQQVAQVVGLQYDPRMVEGWVQPFHNANSGYNPRFGDETLAWTSDAATSTGIHAAPEAIIDISRLPETLQDHMARVALPTYQTMVGSDLV